MGVGNVRVPAELRLTVEVPLTNVEVVAEPENTVPFINIDPAVDNASVHVPLTIFVADTAAVTSVPVLNDCAYEAVVAKLAVLALTARVTNVAVLKEDTGAPLTVKDPEVLILRAVPPI